MASDAGDGQPFYFGWISPSRTEPDSDKFDFAFQDEPSPPEVAEEFAAIVGLIPRIRPTLIDFMAVRADHGQLARLPGELSQIFATARFAMLEVGVRNIETHVLADVVSALSSTQRRRFEIEC